jgi:DNA repair exonuclease SbcCD nuclease subunit
MSKIFCTGDTHIPIDIRKLNSKFFPEGNTLTKDDYVIVCGDFGLLWEAEPDKEELRWKNWLELKPWTTLFIDGNHENFNRLNDLEIIDKFGGKVGKVSDSIFHLRRGECYEIDNKKILTIGGATSTDKEFRKDQISWWKEEELNQNEINKVLDTILEHDKFDIVLSHTVPIEIINEYMEYFNMYSGRQDCSVSKLLQHVYENINFDKWYAGHMHPVYAWESSNDNRIAILYDAVIKVWDSDDI